MSKLLSQREMELLHLAVNLAVQLDRCNPEVGMGPFPLMIAEELVQKLSFDVDEDDLHEICQDIRGS